MKRNISKNKRAGNLRSTSRRSLSRRTRIVGQKIPISVPPAGSISNEKEAVEQTKFTEPQAIAQAVYTAPSTYNLPWRYNDNRIMLLPRDPWWLHTYWDLSSNRINEVISKIPQHENHNLRWVLRVYDVSGVKDFNGRNANSFFDIDINFDANNWYINVNQPEKSWCVEIGLKTPSGSFFAVARSNIVRTPCFGISNLIDEEWAMPDDEYFKMLGVYDLGKSSLAIKKRFEEVLSSPMASWGVSSLFSERPRPPEKFFLEVWTELILYGRTHADAELTVEGRKVNLNKDGTFALRYALPVGDFKFEVVAKSKDKKHTQKKTPAVKRFEK